MNDVDETIVRLKARYHVTSDSDLAKVLGINKSTISSWKARGKIPDRIMEVIESSMVAVGAAPVDWGPFQHYAFGLALQRFSRVLSARYPEMTLQDALKLAASSYVFFAFMGRAEGAILNIQETGEFNYETATAMLLHEDLANPQKALERDTKVFLENFVK